MTSRQHKHVTIYNKLSESIDYDSAKAVPIKLNQFTKIEVGDLDAAIILQKYDEDQADMILLDGSILREKYNDNYYNVGFSVDYSMTQVKRTDYRTLAKLLGIVVKSTINWVIKNKPDVLTIGATGATDREHDKKIAIYGAILDKNLPLMEKHGYFWDYTKFDIIGKGMFIAKKSLFEK